MPMKKLTEREIITIMGEAYDELINESVAKLDELQLKYKDESGDEKETVSDGLKIRHKESGLLYTVDELGMRDATLITPEGDKIVVNHKTLEDEYEVD